MNGGRVSTIARRVGVGALAVGVGVGVLAAARYVAGAVRRGERETVRGGADAIVVLGAQVHRNGRPSAALRGRVLRAVALYHAGYAPRLVLTGGVGESGVAEAVVMEALAVAQGVPATACVLE